VKRGSRPVNSLDTEELLRLVPGALIVTALAAVAHGGARHSRLEALAVALLAVGLPTVAATRVDQLAGWLREQLMNLKTRNLSVSPQL
jgi:hypothetical protein